VTPLENSTYSRVPKMLLDWQLYVACYYPTTPTDYASTTRGMSVGHTVAVNIDFCGYLHFWALVSSELYGYSTPGQPFWSSTRVRFIGQCWHFNPQWTPEQVIIKARSVRTLLVSWENCAVTTYLHLLSICIDISVCGGV